MAAKSRWIKRTMKCPEGDYEAELLIEVREKDGIEVLNSVQCNNPKFRGLDNWDCRWSCWEKALDMP